MPRFSAEQRRRRLQNRHGLDSANRPQTPAATADRLVALHATDPATVYLSVLARSPSANRDHIAAALYEERTLVRMMAMRRTLFVVGTELAPIIQHAASDDVAARLRRGLLKDLRTLPTDPEMPADVDGWLDDVAASAADALRVRGVATANELAADEPRLRTAILPTTEKSWDVRRNITSRVLVLLGAEGRIVRGRTRGQWTSRMHSWEPIERWWPQGLPALGAADARRELASRWLAAFGPATPDDLQWWTGWTKKQTTAALAELATVEVELDGASGVVLADDLGAEPLSAPSAALLPALDPTPMGWKRRDWYVGEHTDALFDRFGNIGPTIWWDGRIVGGWAVASDGAVRTRLLEDVGSAATEAIANEAARIEAELGGDVVVPAFRTPLERELSRA